MLSQLHDNLVVLFYDYLSEKPFLSFIGSTNLSETATELLEYSKRNFQVDFLKLIPESVALDLPDNKFRIVPDEDSHDYILSVSFLKDLCRQPASKITHAGKGCKRFLKFYPHYHVKRFSDKEISINEHIALFKSWADNKNHNHGELNEFKAFERLLLNNENGNIIVSFYDGNLLIGFVTVEILSNDYAMAHFGKANTSYKGIYDALLCEVGKMLDEKGIKYLNFEQDLGIPTLRLSKSKYKPVFFLKKFIITKTT